MTWDERWRQVRLFTQFVVRRFIADDCQQHAASLTYTTLFAVVPMLTVVFSILAAIPSMKHVSADIQNFIFSNMLPSSGIKIQNYLSNFASQASNLTLVGVFMLFVTALLMLRTIEKAFNEIWKVRQPRQSVIGFLRYWAVLSLGPFLLGAAFAVSSYLTSLQILSDAEAIFGSVLPGLQVVPLLFTALAFTLLYIAVPNCRVPVRSGYIAGIFSAVLFEIAKKGFAFFVSNFSSYEFIYGAFAAFPLFLLWVYLSWMIVLLGVEVARALTLYKDEQHKCRHPVLTLLDVLQLFHRRHIQGRPVTEIEAMQVIGRHDIETWAEFVGILSAQRLIQKTENGSYVLSRNLDHVDLWEFYLTLPWPLPQPRDFEHLHEDDNWARALAPRLQSVYEHNSEQLRCPLSKILSVE